ncbi:MAG: family transcriptional regulator, dissimilatory nitrate respiration regulator [Acetobacterium sp.]|jgi:CRP-like cAMP-binding protein|uniref:Crp/Fnr family transcriptional regulator n=1 Tax=Acetobacterium sp. KB-1 TaxID=2184575 RepID=UPI000DBEC34D|nr:Crp/Fnr family transcriptional regulator [Acetobacterium sp. KB-1]AWW26100.1 Crp/Fnr family transcriptional regulator [Acetobacterium sp. KB-1]MDK2943093.1 family transcriptional regulator, dissimilatory nitrate respiration regulator [Acetobacterium sp.]
MNHPDLIAVLSCHGLFLDFSEEELNQVFRAHYYEKREYEKDQVIHFQNECCRTMDLILSGRVAVQNLDCEGNVMTINIFQDGDVLGANLIFSSRNNYPMTVLAQSQVVILHLHKELILELCQMNRTFMIGLMKAISDKTLILTDKISAISMKSIRQCIIDFLRYESQIQKSQVIQLPSSKKELAQRFGIQRSSLSRELNKMRQDQMIDFNTKTITIKNING